MAKYGKTNLSLHDYSVIGTIRDNPISTEIFNVRKSSLPNAPKRYDFFLVYDDHNTLVMRNPIKEEVEYIAIAQVDEDERMHHVIPCLYYNQKRGFID